MSLAAARLPAPLLALCQYMAELVDEDGYLLPADLDGLQELKIPQALIRQALDIMQGLEPAGVCARSLSECLALQLTRQENVSPAALDIVSRFLPELGDKRYNRICQELGLSMKEAESFRPRSLRYLYVRISLSWSWMASCGRF